MRILISGLVLVGLAGLPGCVTQNDKDTIVLAGGRVVGVIDKPVMRVTTVARKVAIELKLTVVQYTSDESGGRVVAYTTTSQRILIETKPEKDGRTRISIQTEGDGGELASTQVMKKIKDEV